MPTVRKTTAGESLIHNHGTVAGGDTIDVDGDTAEYLVETGGYERVDTDDASDAQSDAGDGEGDSASDADADADDGEVGGGLDLATDYINEKLDEGTCPWCDEYDGESVGRHASSAHTEAWNAHKEATE